MSIVGIISNLPNKKCENWLEKMLNALQYESFYNTGIFTSYDLNIYIGWTSHKHSFSDCMPIVNEKENIYLFITGEVFSDSDKITELLQKGHKFNNDNASYLVHLYEEYGEDFFEKLNGQFSGVLIDKKRKISFLFNDRFGINRIFTYQKNDCFFFSSEAKAILVVNPETRDFDSKGIIEFLTTGCTFGENSLFKSIKVLSGGSYLTFKKEKLYRKNFYFDSKKWENQDKLTLENFYIKFIEHFNKIVKRYTFPVGKVGLSLTGGIDSRLVISAADPQPNSLPCYTFCSKLREPYDVKIGRKVALKCKQSYKAIIIDNKFINKITDYLEKAVFISDGYMGLEGAIELFVNSIARLIAPIRLTGNYGSEILRQVRFFKYIIPKGNLFNPEIQNIQEEVGNYFKSINNQYNNLSFLLFFQAPFQGYGRRSIEGSQLTMRTPFLDNDLLALLYKAPESINGFTISRKIVESKNKDLLNIDTDRGYWGSGNVLVKQIRQYFRQNTFKIEYMLGHGSPDLFIKLSGLIKFFGIEKIFMNRHKFYDIRLLTREYLTDYIKDLLLDNSNAKYLSFINRANLENIIFNHIKQRNNYSLEINKILTIALIEKIFFK